MTQYEQITSTDPSRAEIEEMFKRSKPSSWFYDSERKSYAYREEFVFHVIVADHGYMLKYGYLDARAVSRGEMIQHLGFGRFLLGEVSRVIRSMRREGAGAAPTA